MTSSRFALVNFLEPTPFSVCWLDPWRQNPQIWRGPCPFPSGCWLSEAHPPKPPVPDLMGRGGRSAQEAPSRARSGRAPWTDCVERLQLIHQQLSAQALLPCAGRAFTGILALWQKPGFIPSPPGLGSRALLAPGLSPGGTQSIGCAQRLPLWPRGPDVSIPGCLSGSALRWQGSRAARVSRMTLPSALY